MTEPTDPLQALTELYEDVTKGLGWTRRLEKLFREKDPEQTEVSFSDEAENWNEASLLFERFVDLFPALKEQMERVEDRPSLGDRWTIEWSTRAEKAEAEVKRLREALSKYESFPDYLQPLRQPSPQPLGVSWSGSFASSTDRFQLEVSW